MSDEIQAPRKVYLFTVNRIEGDNRVSLSMTATEFIAKFRSDFLIESDQELQNGVKKEPDLIEENHILLHWLKSLKTSGSYCSWMDGWTSMTIYLLYQGTETFNV